MVTEIGDDYRERLADWVAQEQKRTGLTDRAFADRLEISYGTPGFWRSRKLKKPLTDDSINAIAKYRHEEPAQTRSWLEGRSPDSQLGLPEEVNALKDRLTILEKLLSEALKSMKAPRSIADLIKHWQIREGLTQFEFELQATTIGLISPERIREILKGLPASQITDDDLAVVGAIIVKMDGTDYNMVELQAIRDQSPPEILRTLMEDCNCEDVSEDSPKVNQHF